MKKILIALDYHPTAQTIAEHGYALAKKLNAEVVLVHVLAESAFYFSNIYDPIMGFGGYADLSMNPMSNIENLKETSYRFLNSTKDHLDDDNIQTFVKEGNTADEIIITATALHANIIVLGSHSQGWAEHLFMGSVTAKVLQHITIPLYVIPTKK